MLVSIRFWAGVAASVVFIALFLRTLHLGELADAFREAEYWYLAPALLVLFTSIYVRCIRWSVLMRPVAPLSPSALLPYAIIGYMANNLLPARAGELVRAWVLGRREHVSRTAAIGTIAVERLFDGCVLVLMLLISGAVVGFDDSRLRVIAMASSVLFLVAFVVFYVITLSEARAHRFISFFLRWLPERLEHKAEDLADNIVVSVRSVHDPKTMGLVFLLSGAAWTIEAGSYAIVGLGFDLDVGFGEYCLLLAASNLAIIIPTFLGGTGPFEWATRLVLESAGVATAVASAYAIIAHALVIVPTTIIGLLIIWSYGIRFSRIARVEPVEEEAVAAP